MQILSNYSIQCLYHFENSVLGALKSEIVTFHACKNKEDDIWLQFDHDKSEKSAEGCTIDTK